MAPPQLSLTNSQTDLPVRRPRILRSLLLRAVALSELGPDLTENDELAFSLIDSETIADINDRHLSHTGPTDVITFDYRLDDPMTLPGEPRSIGEVVVCPAMAIEHVARHGGSVAEETVLYLVHGLLHLCGYDDLEDDVRLAMRRAETNLMDRLRAEFAFEELFGAPTRVATPRSPGTDLEGE